MENEEEKREGKKKERRRRRRKATADDETGGRFREAAEAATRRGKSTGSGSLQGRAAADWPSVEGHSPSGPPERVGFSTALKEWAEV